MAEIKAKKVRLLAPGGGVLNFVGVTGNSHFAYPVSTTLIKTALERKIRVFETLATPAEDGSTEVELTLENYASDNGGAVVAETDCVVPDIEKEVSDLHADEAVEWIKKKGREIKARNDAAADTVTGGAGNDSVPGGTGSDTLNGGSGNTSVPGATGNDSVPGGTGSDTLNGGAGSDTVLGPVGGDPITEGPEN